MRARRDARFPMGLWALLVLGGFATMAATGLLLEALGIPRPGDLAGGRSAGSLVALLIAVAVLAPLTESGIVLVLADRLSRTLRPAESFALLWVLWAIAHLVLQSDLRGIIPGTAGWAFLAPYFRVRSRGRRSAYWALVGVHAGINLLGAAWLIVQRISL